MRRKIALTLLSLLFVIRALEAGTMPSGEPAETKASPETVWVTFELLNVTPASHLTIQFQGGRFVGEPKLAAGSRTDILPGLRLQEGALSFSPPPKSLGEGYSRVAFAAPMVLTGKVSGTLDAQAPVVAIINAGWGATTIQGGSFRLATQSLPPSCTLGCLDGLLCRNQPGANCYLYDSMFMCCTVCPTGC
ncbi:MAG TPA: hypothetical protein VGX68_29810 [Thermoanaerobaculia bacterium]|jgi:hypothetical protein|nr:hypothetical protein [Thermoanaerobaculia bacterium]